MRVDELMTRDVLTARPETPLREVTRRLAASGVSGLPVVDGVGRVLGVVSEADVIADGDTSMGRRRLLSLLHPRGRAQLQRGVATRTAADAMSAPPLLVGPSATVTEAAELMSSGRVNRLPVVDVEGRLVGILARSDVVRSFARPDEELELEIRELLVHVLSIPRGAVRVSVRHGEATVAGRIETPDLEELLVALVRQVPGVLSVETALGYERARSEAGWPRSGRLFAGVG